MGNNFKIITMYQVEESLIIAIISMMNAFSTWYNLTSPIGK